MSHSISISHSTVNSVADPLENAVENPAANSAANPAAHLSQSTRWPLALAIAAGIELALIALALGTQPKQVPIEEPVKVARLVTIADAPSLPTQEMPAPPKKTEAPKPVVKPAPSPALPTRQTDTAAAAPTVAPSDKPSSNAQPEAASAAKEGPKAAAPAVKPERASGLQRGLVPLLRVEPEYPPRALASNTEGVVTAHVTIEKDGSVSAVNIVNAQPARIFDQAATRALLRWKFSPNDGGMIGEVELRFNLN